MSNTTMDVATGLTLIVTLGEQLLKISQMLQTAHAAGSDGPTAEQKSAILQDYLAAHAALVTALAA